MLEFHSVFYSVLNLPCSTDLRNPIFLRVKKQNKMSWKDMCLGLWNFLFLQKRILAEVLYNVMINLTELFLTDVTIAMEINHDENSARGEKFIKK